MAVYDPFRPNVVVFGDSNSYVFGPALRAWLERELGFARDQVVVKYRSSSAPSHWLATDDPSHLSRLGQLWTLRGRFTHGPSVADALSDRTRLVVIGLGGNASSYTRLQRSVPALLRQVEAAAPRAAIVWRGPPPATRTKGGRWATARQRQVRFEKSVWLQKALEELGFVSLASRRLPKVNSPTRLFVDLMALHGRGPYASVAIGSDEALRRDRALFEKAGGRGDDLRVGPWNSYTAARDGLNTHVPRGAAKHLVDEVLPVARLFARAHLLGDDPTPERAAELYEVVDARALIRSGPPNFRWLRPQKFDKGARVLVTERNGDHVFARERDGDLSGWTLASNLERYEAPGVTAEPDERTEHTAPETPRPAWTVVDSKALVRSGPPSYRSTGEVIKRWSKVTLTETRDGYGLALDTEGTKIGWTALSNLANYHKDNPALRDAAMAPATELELGPSASRGARAIAGVFNRMGGLMQAVASGLGFDVEAALAVWMVESAGRSHQPGQAIIRFENHLLWRRWGQSNASTYDRHFRHGGRRGVSGKSWQKHQYRPSGEGRFASLHGKQAREYEALELASRLAGRSTALQCISIGGPQILVSNFRILGYATPREMYDAFQAEERAHVLGFFDFCEGLRRDGRLIRYLRQRDWSAFGRRYNGSASYGPKIAKQYRLARQLLA